MFCTVETLEILPEDRADVRRGWLTMKRNRLAFVSLVWLSVLTAPTLLYAAQTAPVFEDSVAPILTARCGQCHNASRSEGGLDLSSPTGVATGGESGPVLLAGRPEASPLLSRILSGEMPPEDETPVTGREKQTLREWIAGGAKYRVAPRVTRRTTQHDAYPVLLLRCTACHGTRRREGGLDLRTRESILKGGRSGPAAVPGSAATSRLVKRIHAEEMPPRRLLVSVSVKPMTPTELEVLERWIDAGLPVVDSAANSGESTVRPEDRRFWSFQPPQSVSVPAVSGQHPSTPIDAFIERKLNSQGLTLADPADRLTLLRRVCFDLTGLPPTVRQQKQFLSDQRPDAWEHLIERLLASPRYGERWASYWLDVSGYADSEGAQNEDRIRPHMWRYRDYVVRSFNSDKPYDRFLMEQIAGDEMVDYQNAEVITPEIYDCLVATGFLRTTPDRTFADITNFVPDRLEVIADEMQVLGSAVFGLTIHCARCHDHKFDPVSQRDYYSLTAIFKGAYDEHDWLKSQGPRTLKHVTTAERKTWEAGKQQIDQEIQTLKQALKELSDEAGRKELEAKIRQAEARRRPEPRIRALWSRGDPSPAWLLRRGNYLKPGPAVRPDVPAVLAAAGFSFQIANNEESPESGLRTGRRLAFARWITHPQHPLTARVIVNRVWKHHFGHGLVRTLDNFGVAGERPTHPELLDWLAVEFVNSGWSVKWLHRQILVTDTWRQTSRISTEEKLSTGQTESGALLRYMPLRRMEAEVVRDSLLSVSGQLQLQPFGPADSVDVQADGLVTAGRFAAGWRRSIYVLQRRTKIPTLLENFDFPQMGPNCSQRGESIVAPQALHLLNNQMVHELAGHFASRVRSSAGREIAGQVRWAYQIALGRPPDSEEERLGREMLLAVRKQWQADGGVDAETAAQKSLANYCHAILNSAEFLYID